jgi:hypothetical protein
MHGMELTLEELVAAADGAYQEFRWKVVDCLPAGTPLSPNRLSPQQRHAMERFHEAEQNLAEYRRAQYEPLITAAAS